MASAFKMQCLFLVIFPKEAQGAPHEWTSDSTHPTQPVQNTARKYITLDLIKQHCAVYSCIRSDVDIFYSLLLVSLRSVSHKTCWLFLTLTHSLTHSHLFSWTVISVTTGLSQSFDLSLT